MTEYVVTREVWFIRRTAVCPKTGDPDNPGWRISIPPDLGFDIANEDYEALGSPVKGDFLKVSIEKVQSSASKEIEV